jgi:hypothetical protein
MPWFGLNNAFIRFVCAVLLSLSDSNHADVSVIAAPKPTMLWNVCVSSTLTVPEPDEAEKPRLGCGVKCWLRSEVVNHFWTTSFAAEAGDAGITTSESPSVPANAPAKPARRIALDIRAKPLIERIRIRGASAVPRTPRGARDRRRSEALEVRWQM